MIVITVSIILPLSLARKLDRLTGISAVAIGFYIIFSFYVNIAYSYLSEIYYDLLTFRCFYGQFQNFMKGCGTIQ